MKKGSWIAVEDAAKTALTILKRLALILAFLYFCFCFNFSC